MASSANDTNKMTSLLTETGNQCLEYVGCNSLWNAVEDRGRLGWGGGGGGGKSRHGKRGGVGMGFKRIAGKASERGGGRVNVEVCAFAPEFCHFLFKDIRQSY